MIHVFGKEGFMRKRYDRTLQEGYAAMERTNFTMHCILRLF